MSRLLPHAFVACLALASAGACHAAPVFSLADDGAKLVRFDTASPWSVTTVGAIGGAIDRLDGMDFRPSDGRLYGYSHTSGSVYLVDVTNATTTLVSTLTTPTNSFVVGIDFNPVPDRLRIVTGTDQNLRVNVATGATIVDTPLSYAIGDVNAGRNPNIVDAAYTNADRDPATGTTLYYIDFVLDTLVSTTNPNAGVLNTIGSLGVDTDGFVGFDILTDAAGTNLAFASLTDGSVAGIAGLYRIDLVSGAASRIGDIGAVDLFGLAIAPVPEPGSLALVFAAGSAGWLVRRRRNLA